MRRFRALTLIIALTLLLAGCLSPSDLWSRIRQAPVPDAIAERALETALSQIGTPYVWGGQSPEEGFDCSGLIIWAYQQAYPQLQLRYASEVVHDTTQDGLWRYNVLVIPPEHMKPGDIVFITNDIDRITHGGLFIEWIDDTKTEFRFVNASSYWGRVEIDTWPVEGTKRDQWFVGAGRLQTVI